MDPAYSNDLHNLQQRNFIVYREELSSTGPQHDLVWQYWAYVQSVNPPFKVDLVPEGATEVTFWYEAKSRQEAKKQVARNVLYAIQYYEPGRDDVLTPAGIFANQPPNVLPN
ncbi:hypothetical protein M407DRAFT_18932 [Tulasnella calospora MUT 4182]|uniref:DRBM domain-containing protein n=1 Tax=Tulasnella calospora MUT 4182 TaxID=1051891 RepID=A0A0C3QST7_9AGAM|nr:hypothetical protein M407DRAFT_18932 [Tulasnella calospora MUT 4182]